MIKPNSTKPGRVKVGVRCRPAFQDEIDFAKGEFLSIVDIKPEDREQSSLGQISLTLITGKQRDFSYDYAFNDKCSQDYVYDRIARPVVTDVLKGFNGTIFAYGQTGTGKTYTMGILEFVNNEHAGIIPRAISQIFEHVEAQDSTEVSISLSFLQLYRETIQDLLSPAASASGGDSQLAVAENLAVREDPQRGFFVEGLQEFSVRSYREAEALVNLGLENRAIAPTLMNATSSRSHTVLTINIEQRLSGDGNKSFTKTLRSKLLMVDLAGSERVRRTVSKGTRLSEAKSINTSLSALGNVIAALAEQNVTHVPYRDSKLTRLLQDSLGGTASTALVATVGPAAVNYGETLSTLLFASRCMAVKIMPIQHEEVDYAEMCAKLQAQVSSMEGVMTARLLEQQEAHEQAIRDLQVNYEAEKSKAVQQEFSAALQTTAAARQAFDAELNSILDRLERAQVSGDSSSLTNWLGKPEGWKPNGEEMSRPDAKLVTLLGYSFEVLSCMNSAFSDLLAKNQTRDDAQAVVAAETLVEARRKECDREAEMLAMERCDPKYAGRGIDEEDVRIGGHLAPMSKLEALSRVQGKFPSNNGPVSQLDRMADVSAASATPRASIYSYGDPDEIAVALASMHSAVRQNASSLDAILARKDVHFASVKSELTEQMVEKRKREEEVINWSYILKYLLASSSKLRKQLQRERKIEAALAHSAAKPPHGDSMDSGTVPGIIAKRSGSGTALGSIFGRVQNDSGSEDAEDVEGAVEEGREEGREEDTSADLAAKAATNFTPFINLPPPPPPVPAFVSGPRYENGSNGIHAAALYDNVSEVSMSPLDTVRMRKQQQSNDQRLAALHRQHQLDQHFRSDARDTAPPLGVNSRDDDAYEPSVDLMSDLSVSTATQSASFSLRSSSANTVQSAVPRSASALPTPVYGFTPQISSQNTVNRSVSASRPQQSSFAPPINTKPSAFAQEVVQSLGVDQHQAEAAMSIVDQVLRITPEQLRLLDAETRTQILQIRKELKLDGPAASVRSGGSTPSSASNQRRSMSTPKMRPTASAAEPQFSSRSRSGTPTPSLHSNSVGGGSGKLSFQRPLDSRDSSERNYRQQQQQQQQQQYFERDRDDSVRQRSRSSSAVERRDVSRPQSRNSQGRDNSTDSEAYNAQLHQELLQQRFQQQHGSASGSRNDGYSTPHPHNQQQQRGEFTRLPESSHREMQQPGSRSNGFAPHSSGGRVSEHHRQPQSQQQQQRMVDYQQQQLQQLRMRDPQGRQQSQHAYPPQFQSQRSIGSGQPSRHSHYDVNSEDDDDDDDDDEYSQLDYA